VIFKSFFDGSKQADSRVYDVLSLASVSGTSDQWRYFESDWREMLRSNDAKWLHTTDVAALVKDPFTSRNGWTVTRADSFLNDCVRVAEKHVVIPNVKPGLIPYVFTVVLADLDRAAKDHPSVVPNDANEFCAVQSVFRVMQQGAHLGADFFHFVFDQNEPFRGYVIDRRDSKKAKRAIGPVYERIVSNTQCDMRDSPGLQLADLFGWCISNKKQKNRRKWHNRVLRYRKWIDDWNGYDRIMQSNPATKKSFSRGIFRKGSPQFADRFVFLQG